MLQGKVQSALRLLSESSAGVLTLSPEVMSELNSKHPESAPINDEMVLQGPVLEINNVIYDGIHAELIRNCILRTKGTHGPSNLDADAWKRMTNNSIFGSSADDLCHSIALLARKLCSEKIKNDSLEALMACRLIPLDKSPGVRPIGIGEVLRRIVGKAVMSIVREDVLKTTGYQQLCAGQEAGAEVAVHAIREAYDDVGTEAFIQIDAENAFNSINRLVLLQNIKILCPEFATFITNCYLKPARLFISNDKEILSKEGTTQGDPVAMAMYAIGLMPLLTSIFDLKVLQVAFAGDLTGSGKLENLKDWWDNIVEYGPFIGYFVKESKSWLVVKHQYLEKAEKLFANSGIKVSTNGRKDLGSVIGDEISKSAHVSGIVNGWIDELKVLSNFAKNTATCGLRRIYAWYEA